MSTLANIVVLLRDWRKATRNNNSISVLFIAYQGAMLFSTIVRYFNAYIPGMTTLWRDCFASLCFLLINLGYNIPSYRTAPPP